MSYKTTCPNCGGHNFYVTEHNGVKYCFNCAYVEKEGYAEENIKVRSLHVEEIRKYYTEVTRYYHSCLDTKHRDFLHQRGIEDSTIERLQIGFCPNSSHQLYVHPLAEESGISIKREPFLSNRIIFPYWFEGKVTDMRGRTVDMDELKYKSPFKSAYYRGADYAYNVSALPEETIVITEGEIKSILPEQFGLPTKGLPGMNAERTISVGTFKKVVLCFDNQRYNRKQLIMAIKRWAQKLPNPFIATLPLRGKDKQDIDGYILQYGIDSYKQVIAAAMPYEKWKGYVYGY